MGNVGGNCSSPFWPQALSARSTNIYRSVFKIILQSLEDMLLASTRVSLHQFVIGVSGLMLEILNELV